MRFDILTLFPEMFDRVLDASLLGKARDNDLINITVHNLRNWSVSKHDDVDARPYGGGPGMVLRPEPVFRAVEAIQSNRSPEPQPVLLTPKGETLNQQIIERLADDASPLLLICGHYEGFDERIRKGLDLLELSIGDYVLSGGEIPAMVLVDAISRLVPGVVGDPDSVEHESFSTGRLDYPQYTRPREFRDLDVPDVLLSGDHQAIEAWRKRRADELTEDRRPDLLQQPDEPEKEPQDQNRANDQNAAPDDGRNDG